MFAFLIIFYLVFTLITWVRFRFALGLAVFLLPTYLIRFHIGPLPTTFLEGMMLILIAVWITRSFFIERRFMKEVITSISQSLNLSISLPLFLFLIASIISIFVAPDLRAALGLWRAYIIEPLLFFIILLDTARRDERLIHAMLIALAASALVLSMIAIYQYFTGWMIPYPWQALPGRRVTSIFPYPNALGLYLAPIVVLLTGWLTQRSGFRVQGSAILYAIRYTLYALSASLSFIAILAAKSHGAIAGVVAGLFIIGISTKKLRILSVSTLILISVLIGAYAPWRTYVMSYLTFTTASGKIRISQYQETMQMLRDGRMLQGAGLSGYKKTVKPYHKNKRVEIYPYPHNIILNFWAELGLLGLLSFLWLIVAIFANAIKKIKTLYAIRYTLYAPTAALTALLVHGLVDVPFFKNDLAILFWIIIALCLIPHPSVIPGSDPGSTIQGKA